MKKLTLVLCVVVAMAFVGMVFAQTATPPQKQTPPQPTKTVEKVQTPAQPAKPMPKAPVAKPAEGKKVKMTEKRMMGVVVSVDAVANTIVVKHPKRGESTFEATPTTKITVAGKEAKLADIMKDSKVTVAYKWEGKKKVATAIKCE
jgi:hypothetical protein